MENWYLVGMGVGILVGLVAAIVSHVSGNKGKAEYDERQVAARGKCFMTGFWAMAFSNAVLSVVPFMTGKSIFVTPEMGNLVAVIIGIGSFAASAICKDAYFTIHEKKRSFFVMGIALAVLLSSGTVRFAMEGMLIEDGKLSDRSLTVFVLVLWLVIMATQALHSRKEDREE